MSVRQRKTPIRSDAQPDNSEPLRDSVPLLLRDTHRLLLKALQKELDLQGLSSGHWYFLRMLWNEEGLNQAELGGRVGFSTPMTMVTLKKLEDMGLVRRRPDPHDKRKLLIFLTPKGRELKLTLLRRADQVNQRAFQGVTDADVGVLRDVLRAIQVNLLRSD